MNEDQKKAAEKAMHLLLHKDRTEQELTSRLHQAGFSDEAVAYAITYVKGYGYIDDLRYASSFISLHKTGMSRRQLTQKLKERGVSAETLAEAFASYETEEDDDPEGQALNDLLAKRLKGRDVSELTWEEKQKQMRYLVGKGYPLDRVRKLLDAR